jgi:hypothetical protein
VSKNQDWYNALSAEEKAKFNAEMDAFATKRLRPPDPPAPDGNAHWHTQPHGPTGERGPSLGEFNQTMAERLEEQKDNPLVIRQP